MYATTMGPNVKRGAQISNGGRAPLPPPLATALLLARFCLWFTNCKLH